MGEQRTEFAILGAGVIGSIIGAHLARAGHSVVMLVRERRARQIDSEGLRIKGLSDFSIPVPALTDASQLRSAGTLIVATKTPGTEQALEPLRNAEIGVAFSIQNGLWKNEALARALGADRVLGCLANTSGEVLPSGEVLFTRNVNVYVGELAGGMSARAERIAQTLEAAGVRVDEVRRLGGTDADVDHDPHGDLALSHRRGLRVRAGAAGARGCSDCESRRGRIGQREHVTAAARNPDQLGRGGHRGRAER